MIVTVSDSLETEVHFSISIDLGDASILHCGAIYFFELNNFLMKRFFFVEESSNFFSLVGLNPTNLNAFVPSLELP